MTGKNHTSELRKEIYEPGRMGRERQERERGDFRQEEGFVGYG
jgi:hypothetical protein